MKATRNPFLSRLAITASLNIVATACAFAAPATWNVTTDGDWSLATNWNGGVPGVSGNTSTTDTAGFGGATNYTTYLAGTRSINTVTYSNTGTTALLGGTTATAANETINLFGGVTINAGSGAVTIGDTASSPTRSVNIRMGTSTIANNSPSLLTLANGLGSRGTGSTSTTFVTLGGTGNTILSGSVGPGAGAALALIKANSGTVTLSGNNSFAGGLAINAGTLTISAATNTFSGGITLSGLTAGTRLNLNSTTALGAAASGLTISGGSNASINNSSAGAITIANNNPQSWSSDFTFVGTQNLNMGTGNITLGGTRQITASASTLTLGGVIADGASTFGLTKAGSGTIVLANANTYDGVTTVNAGVLRPTNTDALGSTTGGSVAGAGSIELTAGLTPNPAEALTINGSGADFFGALRAGAGGGTWAGPIAIGIAGARIGATTGNTLTITGTIADGASNTFAISGQSGTGVVIINPTTINTYTGKTDIVRGILRLGKTDALPTGTMLDVDSASGVADAAVLDLAGFNQTAGGLRDGATNNFSGRVTNSVAATTSTLTLNQFEETFYEGTIENGAGTVALVKNGSGTLNLNRANTYTGATSVNAGRLNIGLLSTPGITLASPVTVAAGATIGGEGTSSSSLTFDTGSSALVFNPTTVESLTAASVSTTGATVVITPDSSLTSGITYTVLTNSAGFSGSPSPTYTPSSRGTLAFGGPLSGELPTELQFTAADPVTTLTWKGNAASPTLWDINATANWDGGSGATTFFDFDTVSFDDSATTTDVVIQPASVNVGGITVNNPTKSYTFSGGSITGTGDILKNGNASLTLSNANSFTGGVTLNAGTLNINNSTALGTAAGTFLIAGGTIDNTSGSAITTANYPLTLDANLNFTGSNDLNLGSGITNLGNTTATSRTITTASRTLRLGGAIADGLGGANEIIKAGAGTLTLAGASTYTGPTNISAGTLLLGASGAAASGPLGSPSSGTVVSSGATLDFGGFRAFAEPITIAGDGVAGSGALINSGATQTNALESLTLTANASIGGNGNRFDLRLNTVTPTLNLAGFTLTKSGSSYVALVGTNVIPGSGNIDVTGGTLGVQTTTLMNGSSANSFFLRDGANLDCFQSGTWTAPVWSVLMDAGSSFTNSSGIASWDGPVTLNGAASLGGGAALTITSVISGTSGTLTKIGAGTLTLTGPAGNTYGGLTTVNAGTLALNKAAGNAIPGNATVTGTGTLSNTANDQIPDSATITINSTDALWTLNTRTETVQTLELSGPYTVNRGFVTGIAGKLSVTNLIVAGGGVALNSAGAAAESFIEATTVTNTGGTWTFGTANGTQSLRIGVGGLTIGNGSTIAVGASVASANFISLGGNVTSTAAATTNTISGAGSLNLNATRTFNVADGAAASDLTIASVIADGTGTGALIKTGPGTQTLTAANTYSGSTTIDGGILALGTAGSIANTTAINIAAGAGLNTSSQPTYAMPTGRTFTFSLDAADAGSSGQINAAGLDITNGTVAFNITGPLNDPSYVLATYTSRTGAAFASVTPPSGYTLDYAFNGSTQIALVQSATSPYVTWGTPFGLAAGSEGGDLDNDGLSNFEEFAFGLTPNSGSSVNPITAQLNKTNGQFTYQRLAGSGLTYSVWTSENLITWTEDTAAIQTPTPAGANESVAVTISATPKPLTASRLFIRVRAN